jgi:hypothetical protein
LEKGKIKMQLKFIALIITMFISAASQAQIVSTSFPSLVGRYNYHDPIRSNQFDLGVQFSSITSATIELTVGGTSGSVGPCVALINAPISNCLIGSPVSPIADYIFKSTNSTTTGLLPVDTVETNTFSNILSDTNLFLDGKGIFGIVQSPLDLKPGQGLLKKPIMDVFDITLTVDGVVAPTPDEPIVPIPAPTPEEPAVPVPAPIPTPVVPVPAPTPNEPIAPIPTPTPGVTAVPIPLSLPLFTSGLAGLLLLSKRKRT